MKQLFLFFVLMSTSFSWAIKTPEQGPSTDQRVQTTEKIGQLFIVVVPNVTPAWMQWKLQQARERRQDPRFTYIEQDEPK